MVAFGTRDGLALPARPPWWLSAGPPASSFASLTAGGAAAAAVAPARPQTEPRTKTPFPGEFCHLAKKACPRLTGVGARSKRLMGVKSVDVYSLGVYVDAPALAARARGAAAVGDALLASLADDPALPKTVRIVVTSGLITGPRFVKGVKESLLPALTARGAASTFDSFAALFDGARFSKGTEIVMSNAGDGSLAVAIDGKPAGAVRHPAFALALFSLYLGAAPVSPDGKASVAAGVEAVRAMAAAEA